MTAAQSGEPVASQVEQGAKAGALLGPVGVVGGKAISLLGKAGGATTNGLLVAYAPRAVAAIQAAVAPAAPVAASTGNKLLDQLFAEHTTEQSGAPYTPPATPALSAPNALQAAASTPPAQAIPTALPKANAVPRLTQSAADARADEIIQHFAKGGNLEVDATPLIPGSNPTLAQSIVGGNAGLATLERTLQAQAPRTWLAQPATGTVETMAAPWWRMLATMAPGVRVAVIRRPVGDVVDSLMKLGLPFDRARLLVEITRLDRKLDQIEARLPSVLSVDYAGLQNEATCKALFEHCLPYQHNPAWRAQVAPVNIQVDMHALYRYCQSYGRQLEDLAKIAKQQALTAMATRAPAAPDGMTFQTEPFEMWYRDGRPLFAEHCTLVGETPDDYLRKNVPLWRKLDKAGALQIMTARSNGRMFGYLVSVISPSLETEGLMTAATTTFFASKDAPGIGMTLKRAALHDLKGRGVGQVVMRAGTRGSGPRLGSMFRRLGGQEFGQLFTSIYRE